MSITPKGMSIQEAYRLFRNGNLIVNRKYQRKLVWTGEEKEKLIDSILKGFPIPLILLAERPLLHGHGSYEILDGVQRLTAIFDFIENRISINNSFFDVEEFTRAKTLSENGIFKKINRETNNFITPLSCAQVLDYQLAITIYPAMEEKDMIDVFGRINSQGRQLSNQERRQAGVINDFSNLVRKISFEIRGDVSKDVLALYEMPEISIDDKRNDMNYGIKANDIFWVKSGVLGIKNVKYGEDEELISDILATILLDEPFKKSKEKLDEIYDEESELYQKLLKNLVVYGVEELYTQIIDTLSVVKEIIESTEKQSNNFRKIVSDQWRNPVKSSFYSFFMAIFDLVVKEEMSPGSYDKIMKSIENLQSKLNQSSHYTTIEDRIKNIDLTKGLIQRYFVKKEPKALRHGPGLALDFENSIKRSKIENTRYEFKQGLFKLTDTPVLDENIINKILTTACAMANSCQGEDGYIYIGVADKESDAERIAKIYNNDYIEKFGNYVVGIEREIKFAKWSLDQYLKIIIQKIKDSKIDGPLRSQLMSQLDIVAYKGMTIVRIRVPKQESLTYIDEKVYVRNGNDTKLVESPREIVALSQNFTK